MVDDRAMLALQLVGVGEARDAARRHAHEPKVSVI